MEYRVSLDLGRDKIKAVNFRGALPIIYQSETSAKSHFVILSPAKDLVFARSYEILRSLRSLRMPGKGTFAEASSRVGKAQ
jgi:hypothetical protein